MKRSSGILLWKKENNQYYVLLTHFGGPYGDKLDKGAWSVQKGLVESNEKVLNAAIWTYVSALTTSMLYFLRFLSLAQILSKDRR